jgi:hypothetical protein
MKSSLSPELWMARFSKLEHLQLAAAGPEALPILSNRKDHSP